MILTHMDAVRRARLGAQSTEHAFLVVDGISQQITANHGARFLIYFTGGRLINVDAIDRTCFGTHITGDATIDFKLVDASIARGESDLFKRILDRNRR